MASSTRSKRDTGQRFLKKCGCLNHEIFSEGKSYTMLSTSWLKSRTSFKWLVERDLINTKKAWVCSVCISHAEAMCVSGTSAARVEEDMETDNESCSLAADIDILTDDLKDLKWSELNSETKDKLSKLCNVLGKMVFDDVYYDGLNLLQEYKDVESTGKMNPKEWIKQRNKLLVSFVSGVTGITNDTESSKKTNALTHALEQIYYARNLNIVCCFSFNRNFINYCIHKSKMAAKLNSSWEPAGSYTTVKNILNQPSEEIFCPAGDVVTTFDNSQKVGRSSGRIHEGAKVPVSICTTVGRSYT